jgi:hypothetical protein
MLSMLGGGASLRRSPCNGTGPPDIVATRSYGTELLVPPSSPAFRSLPVTTSRAVKGGDRPQRQDMAIVRRLALRRTAAAQPRVRQAGCIQLMHR